MLRDPAAEFRAPGLRGGIEPLVRHFPAQLCEPGAQDHRQGAAVRGGLGGHVLHELPVGGQSSASRQLPLGGKIRVRRHEAPVQRVSPGELDQKALAGAVPTDDELHGPLAVRHPVQGGGQRVDLLPPSDGDVGSARPGNHAAGEGREQGPEDPPGNLRHRVVSVLSHSSASSL